MRRREPWHRRGEPYYSLYTPGWVEAVARVDRLPSVATRELFGGLVRHVEAGWAIIRPLQLSAERLSHDAPTSAMAADVAAFIDLEVSDVFRGVAHTCGEMVPADGGWIGEPGLDEVEPEAAEVARNLRILALAEQHPGFPELLRGRAGAAAAEYGTWLEALGIWLRPAIETVESALYRRPSASLDETHA